MSTLERAIELAARGCRGQRDADGEPCILRSLRLLLAVQEHGTLAQMAAVLQGAVEQGHVSLDLLRHEGFPDIVVEAIDCLTRRQAEDRLNAAGRAAAHPLARHVKLADVRQKLSRPGNTARDRTSRARRHQHEKVRALLEYAIASDGTHPR